MTGMHAFHMFYQTWSFAAYGPRLTIALHPTTVPSL